MRHARHGPSGFGHRPSSHRCRQGALPSPNLRHPSAPRWTPVRRDSRASGSASPQRATPARRPRSERVNRNSPRTAVRRRLHVRDGERSPAFPARPGAQGRLKNAPRHGAQIGTFRALAAPDPLDAPLVDPPPGSEHERRHGTGRRIRSRSFTMYSWCASTVIQSVPDLHAFSPCSMLGTDSHVSGQWMGSDELG